VPARLASIQTVSWLAGSANGSMPGTRAACTCTAGRAVGAGSATAVQGDSSRADSGRQRRRAAGFMIQVDGSGGNARHGTGPRMTMAAASPGRLCYDGLFPAEKPRTA
jgi:hypothetical protein